MEKAEAKFNWVLVASLFAVLVFAFPAVAIAQDGLARTGTPVCLEKESAFILAVLPKDRDREVLNYLEEKKKCFRLRSNLQVKIFERSVTHSGVTGLYLGEREYWAPEAWVNFRF